LGKDTFKQRRLFNIREYKLADTHIAVKEENLISKHVYKIKYENISDETFEITTYSKPLLWATIIFSALTIFLFLMRLDGGDVGDDAETIWAGFAILFGLFLFNSREKYVGYKGFNQPLLFYKNKPSAEKLKRFIEQFDETRNQYLREFYLTDNHYLSASDEIQKLAWLKENGAITQEEFEILKKKTIQGESGSSIGFKD
jgi:hypothetical protein